MITKHMIRGRDGAILLMENEHYSVWAEPDIEYEHSSGATIQSTGLVHHIVIRPVTGTFSELQSCVDVAYEFLSTAPSIDTIINQALSAKPNKENQ